MSEAQCVGCKFVFLNWHEQRRQFGRAIQRYGLTPEEAKQAMPRCGRCLTELMAAQGRKMISKHEERLRAAYEALQQRQASRNIRRGDDQSISEISGLLGPFIAHQ